MRLTRKAEMALQHLSESYSRLTQIISAGGELDSAAVLQAVHALSHSVSRLSLFVDSARFLTEKKGASAHEKRAFLKNSAAAGV